MDNPAPFLRSLASSLDALRLRLPATDPGAVEVMRAAISARSLARDSSGRDVEDSTVRRIVAMTSRVEEAQPDTSDGIRGLMDDVWNLLEEVRDELGLSADLMLQD